MLVVRIQLTDVFNKLLDWNCFHIICGGKKKEISELLFVSYIKLQERKSSLDII